MQNTLPIRENLCLVLELFGDHFIIHAMCRARDKNGRKMFSCLHRSHFSISLFWGCYTVIWKFLFWFQQCEKLSLFLFSPPQAHLNATKLPVPYLAGCLVYQMTDDNTGDLVWPLSKGFCTSFIPLSPPSLWWVDSIIWLCLRRLWAKCHLSIFSTFGDMLS